MEITERRTADNVTLGLSGRLDTTTAKAFEETILGLIESGDRRFIIDLAQLDYVNSAGLRVLLSAVKEARQRGGDLRLAGAQQHVQKVLEMSGFTSILKIFADVPAAAASFGA